jgi:two-component system cell cycle response regulator DivK
MPHNVAVLYVEDDPLSIEIMDFLLRDDMGLSHVTIWDDSANFSERVAALDPKPDIIFLDIHMRPINGFEMLAILRQMEDFYNTPIVAMTASVMNEEVQTLRNAGFDGAIGKPIDQIEFPDLFERILRGDAIWRITG